MALKHMGHVVDDPEEADLYYVDAWFYNAIDQIQECKPLHLSSGEGEYCFKCFKWNLALSA